MMRVNTAGKKYFGWNRWVGGASAFTEPGSSTKFLGPHAFEADKSPAKNADTAAR